MEPLTDGVAIWEEDIVIPTYPAGEPDHNPMFLEKRVYQGSSGAVYPLAVIDSVSDRRIDKTYHAVYLENEHVKIMVLPQIGGRIHMAYAKALDYHFVYYNQVIKPALVGLAGPWISGGIEFNWPQHHRPSTFSPVDYLLEKRDDGSAVVWLGEIDRMNRTEAVVGISLLPGRAYIKIEGRLFNRTRLPQTFLWWANPAVAVNEDYQSVFPPDVHAVFDHGKRDVSRFPIATGTYHKVDYSRGVDISWWKNIAVPTSYMAYHSDYDFVGGYDHGRRAGILHIADHHLSPGKKQWTWGCGDFGKAWERNLTDSDGPYIELMAGVFTDNQPDFSWLVPGEQKRFEQYFLPYSGIGRVKNASRDAAINIEIQDGTARVGVSSTSRRAYRIAVTRIQTESRGEILLLDATAEVDPGHPYVGEVTLPVDTLPEEIRLVVESRDGTVSLSYREGERPGRPVPEAATAAPPPAEVRSAEELYLIGVHLEQYRHATFSPTDYYEEALRRDPGDARSNQAMGLLLLRRGLFADSEPYFRRAMDRLTLKNPNPSNGEPLYYLGQALELQGRCEEASDAYFKAAWNGALQGAAFGALARLSARRKDFATALSLTEESLRANGADLGTRMLRAIFLRKLGRLAEARIEVESILRDDPLDGTAHNELRLAGERTGAEENDRMPAAAATPRIGGELHRSLEVAFDYSRCGLFEEALKVLEVLQDAGGPGARDPLVHYCRAFSLDQLGRREEAVEAVQFADSQPAGTCFPNQLESIAVLELAGRLFPRGAKSFYYLGNLWYNNRCPDRAIAAWERSVKLDGSFPTPHRNLALAAFNKLGDRDRARGEMELAFSLDRDDARVLFELDQLYKILGLNGTERLSLLTKHGAVVERRDDLCLERITLLNLLGHYAEAGDLLSERKFHPWEGGEGKVTRQYVVSLLGLSKEALLAGRPGEAAALAERALRYPENLGEGKLAGAFENDIHYYLACAYRGWGKQEEAREAFARACAGGREPAISMYYNDQPADMIFFQGLALASIGRTDEARGRFHRLIDYGERHLDEVVKADYFAVSLPDFLVFEGDLSRRNHIFCIYLMGLGRLGLDAVAGRVAGDARSLLERVVAEDPAHLGASEILRDLDRGWLFG